MLIRGDFVDCPALGQLEIYHDHLLSVSDAGFIEFFSPASSPESSRLLNNPPISPMVISSGSFVIPTFCDLHLHAPQFLYQGTGLHLPLMQWLDQYAFKAEEALDNDLGFARKVYKRLAERLIENGTGAVLLFGTIKTETNLVLAEIMQAAGIRAFVGKLSMDISSRPSYVERSADSSVESLAHFVQRCGALTSHLPPERRLVEPVITPRFVPTCSNELLAKLGRLSEEKGLRVQSHMAEAHDQIQWVKRERGTSDIDVFASNGLLTSRTIQAHCTFLDDAGLSEVSRRGTAIAHCPLSNAYFSAEPFRLREALHLGVRVGLGTDIAGGYSLDIMNAARQAVIVSRIREGSRLLSSARSLEDKDSKSCPDEKASGQSGATDSLAIDWKEALYLATTGGMKALGLPRGCGTFSIGAPFDAQWIRVYDQESGSGVGALDFLEVHMDGSAQRKDTGITLDMLEKWFCLGDRRNRLGLWVQGSQLMTRV